MLGALERGARNLNGRSLRKLRGEARKLARDVGHAMRHRGQRLPTTARTAVEARLADVNRAIGEDVEGLRLAATTEALRAEVAKHAAVLRKATPLEYVQSLGMAVGVALLIRGFVIEAFKIPTGSMIPTLLVDDHIFVNKFDYGVRLPFTHIHLFEVGTPRRGDIAVFEYPGNGDDQGKDFIKRVVAVAGDRVHLKDNRLYINGEPVPTRTLDADASCSDATFATCRCCAMRASMPRQLFGIGGAQRMRRPGLPNGLFGPSAYRSAAAGAPMPIVHPMDEVDHTSGRWRKCRCAPCTTGSGSRSGSSGRTGRGMRSWARGCFRTRWRSSSRWTGAGTCRTRPWACKGSRCGSTSGRRRGRRRARRERTRTNGRNT